MIRHCVFVKFRSEISAEERAEIYAGLSALVGQIDGLLSANFGPNVSPEGLSHGFNDGFTMDLADEAARDRYLDDPRHKEAGGQLFAALEGGREGIIVFDMKI
ncbi:Dabb family protein [Devosia submarina]|uniref:Dabb family protein n=1 Tax=Devosia submarina TaxID=1173082 RepID=UPI000D356865|nr:Dabb family protein [Devosia submarina]